VRHLAVALAAVALLLFAVPTAQAARSEFYGITQGVGLTGGDILGMRVAKVRMDRFPLQWNVAEPHKNTYNWTKTDTLIGSLAFNGVRPVPFVWGSPPWAATGGLQRPPVSTASRTAWQTFLKAAVARYGPGGTFWSGPYHQRFGSAAVPLPITSWQIWNEPNLKFSYPGTTYKQKAQKYGQLVQISHTAIRSKDPKAQIVLAGITTQKDPDAYNFLSSLYAVPNIKNSFEGAAQHPYASTDAKIKSAIQRFRGVMVSHGDRATPLWITEFAWGSGPPDSIGINKGLNGQATALTNSYKMLLANRTAWNLQHLFWFLWRDPAPGSDAATGCSFCGTAGFLKNDGTEKPALNAFKAFSADSTAPQATITAGPTGNTTDTTPTFSFKSSEAGSTFQCRFDAKPFVACATPYTGQPLAKGTHTFNVKAIDAAGNESAVQARSFKVV
jgi:hypothetical protein